MFLLTDPATAAEVLLCSTEPSSPLLLTRTEVLLLLGFSCFASAEASALWSFSAAWPAICEPSEPLPPCFWSTSWSALFSFAEAASAAEVLLCFTSPLSPGLSTRTEMFWFEGFSWVDSACEEASCSLLAA